MMEVDALEDRLAWELGYSVGSQFLGDDMVLPPGLSDEKARALIQSETERGDSIFYELKKWSPLSRPSNRIVWLQLWGFPVQAWEIQSFRKVVAAIGDIIEPDDDTEDRRRFDRARLLVRTPLPPTIRSAVNVRVGELEYKVWIVEEAGSDGGLTKRRPSPSEGWSESITSDDDGVGCDEGDDVDTNFSFSPELSNRSSSPTFNQRVHCRTHGCSRDGEPLVNTHTNETFQDKANSLEATMLESISGNNLNVERKDVEGQTCIGELQKQIMQTPSPIPLEQNGPQRLKGPLESQGGCNKEFLYPVEHMGINEGQTHKEGRPSEITGPLMSVEGCHREEPSSETHSLKVNSDKFVKVYSRQKPTSQSGARMSQPAIQHSSIPLCKTKRESMDKVVCKALWGQSEFDWEWVPAVNTAGGLLCVWDNINFRVENRRAERGFILLEGVWMAEGHRVVVVNIYAACDPAVKRQLWQRLLDLKSQSQVQCWCLVGDFNCVRNLTERVGNNLGPPDTSIIADFNDWLADMEIEDIPCLGKPFTWVRPNAMLRSYEMVSGLRINFAKSQFGAIGQSQQWSRSAAELLNCGPLQLPFTYLGMPIGANPRRLMMWEPIFRKFEAKLNKWNQRKVSMAGRITLINSVLTALPLFYLSFFKAPSAVLKRLISIQRNFLWGGGAEGKKIAWVAWDHICVPRKQGGLGIKAIKDFNRALLIKWKWLLFHQSDYLWSRILTSKYKGWRGRNLFDHEMVSASDFIDQVSALSPNATFKDQWVWGADPKGTFSTSSAYHFIREAQSTAYQNQAFSQLWDIKAPPKALAFAWRLMWDRLPTKDNLSRRQVALDSDLCTFCQSQVESASHLFFSCNKIMPLWWEFSSWVNEDRVMHCRPVDHFTQHLSLAASQAINRKWKVWWVAATVSIWNYRNAMIFKNHQFAISKLVDDAIYLTWSWLRGWEKDFAIPFNQWSSSMSFAFS
ncbi:putative ribonuclease H protein [Glycine max]|nr:putative ribonuclease H protein [Glycine max]